LRARSRQSGPTTLSTIHLTAHARVTPQPDFESSRAILRNAGVGGQPVGRLGFNASSLPVIFPINFLLDDRTVYFRSEIGQKTTAANRHSVACLEVDQYDGLNHSGWSVLRAVDSRCPHQIGPTNSTTFRCDRGRSAGHRD